MTLNPNQFGVTTSNKSSALYPTGTEFLMDVPQSMVRTVRDADAVRRRAMRSLRRGNAAPEQATADDD